MKSCFKRIVFMCAMILCVFGSFGINVFAVDDYEIGVFNLNKTANNSAKLGSLLIHPEIGWNRYNDKNPKIQYEGQWSYYNYNNNAYEGEHMHNFNIPGGKIQFKFTGSKLRVITWGGNIGSGANVKIDGVDYGNYTCYRNTSSGEGSHVFFEKLNLGKGIHEVTITTLDKSYFKNSSENWFCLDAIDVDGYLIEDYDEEKIVKGSNVLYIKMADEEVKQVNNIDASDFTKWYKDRDLNKYISPYYKITNEQGYTEFIVHDKIISFQVIK